MKRKHRFMGIFGCLACLGVGGSAYAGTGDRWGAIFDNLIQRGITVCPSENPNGLVIAEKGIRGGMLFVPPRPDVNYEIGNVTPDPGMDYKIHIPASKLRSPLMGLGGRLDGIIRKDMPRR